jgi:putative hemin transport protein
MSTLTPELRDAILADLRDNPSGMTLQLAKMHGVAEAEVIRLLPDGRSQELQIAKWAELFEIFASLGKVHVIVSNASVTCEVIGEFGGYSEWGDFFNVQSKTLDLHIRKSKLGSVFAVIKPSHMDTGRTLSVQFYDIAGDSALKVFLNFSGKPTPEREAIFEDIKQRFAL